MYEPVAEEAGAAIHYDRAARPVPLFGHRQLLAQALSNLIENAVRYGSAGGEIRIGVKTDGKQMRIEVADRGPASRASFAPRRCAGSAGSIPAVPRKAPGSAWRWPWQSRTSTKASWCSRTMRRACARHSTSHSGRTSGRLAVA